MSEFEFWKDIGNISEAIINYQKKNAEFNNRFINPWIRLGVPFNGGDSDQEIVKAYQHATEIDPDTAQNWINLGDIQLKAGTYEEAAIAYRKASELAPQAGWPLSNLAFTLVMQGKYEEAVPLYIASIELHTENKDKVISLNRLGDVFRKLNDYEKAFLSFQKADELDNASIGLSNQPTSISQNISAISEEENLDKTTLQQMHEHEEEEEDFLANFEKNFTHITQSETELPSEPTAQINEALPSWLSEEHKNNLAKPAVETKNARIPEWLVINKKEVASEKVVESPTSVKNDEIMTDQLNGQKESSNYEPEETTDLKKNVAAENLFPDPLKKQPNETAYEEYLKDVVEPMTILSDHMDDINNQANMSDSCETLIATESNNAQVWNELGNMYLKSGSCDDAIAAYSKAIELEHHFAWPYSNLALAYVQKGYYTEAILLCQRSIELFTSDKDKAVTWNRLGNVYRHMNEYDNAIAAYQTADELDPENATLSLRSSFGLLGNLYAEQKSDYVS